jgi:rfaE bifunctional protein kinase chain/domain
MIPALLEKIRGVRALVVGDAMLDRYWYGDVDRISPEAPVPVVHVKEADERPGGAANVARNIQALQARCALLAVTGDDGDADSLASLLAREAIEAHLVRDKLLNTTVKLRVISRHQQLIRIDFESPSSKDSRVKLLDRYLQDVGDYDVVVCSDYGKGGLGQIREMIEAARKLGKPIVIDPKGRDYSGYRGASMITPNRKEFEFVAGAFRTNAELEQKARAMAEELALDAVLVTRSEEGMSYIGRDGRTLHMPARARDVYDVTGAGDTVIATIGCAVAAGADIQDVLHLANVAAGVVVGKLGAETASPQEILHELAIEEV